MSLIKNQFIKTVEGLSAKILGEAYDKARGETYYIGFVIMGDESVMPCKWDETGWSPTLGRFSFPKPVEDFSVGTWVVKDTTMKAVVTTVSPHESSTYRLIGYVVDRTGRMYPERWTLRGSAGSNRNWDLNKYADHTKLPF